MNLAVWMGAAAAALAAATTAGAERPAATVRDLSWIAGSWSCDKRGGEFQEHWMSPEGDSLVGVGRLLVDGRTRFVEYLSIEPDGAGMTMWILLGHASKGPKTAKPFRLTRMMAGEAVFENPENDFPTTITYRKQGPEAMLARLEGKRNGEPAIDDYNFRRGK